MPMPSGSRPSSAALTRSGARKASEIVMLILRRAVFAGSNQIDRCVRVGQQFIEPLAPACDRGDQGCAGFGTNRPSGLVLRCCRSKQFTAKFGWRLAPRNAKNPGCLRLPSTRRCWLSEREGKLFGIDIYALDVAINQSTVIDWVSQSQVIA